MVVGRIVSDAPSKIHDLKEQAEGLAELLEEGIAAIHEVITFGGSIVERGAQKHVNGGGHFDVGGFFKATLYQ